MILTSRVPVRWPDRAQVDAAWSRELDDPDGAAVIGEDGLLRLGGQVVPLRLVSGVHLEPGATYRLEEPRLFATEVEVRIEGGPGARTVQADYRLVKGWRGSALGGLAPRGAAPARASIEGLDAFRLARTTGDLPYLSWEATFEPAGPEVLRARVRLRWLQVRLVARVSDPAEPGTDLAAEPGSDLECELELTGRGPWAPVVGTALALGGRFVREGFEETTRQWAQVATRVAEGRRPEIPRARDWAAELQRWDQAARIVRLRMNAVQDQVDTRPRWRQTRGAWASAYAALPPAGWWPDPVPDTVAWEDYERTVAINVGMLKPAERRAGIDEQVDRSVAHHASIARAHGVHRADEPGSQDLPLPVRDGQLDLRWLRSPRTLWRFARTAETPSGSPEETSTAAGVDPV